MPSQQFPQSEKFNCVFQLIKHQHNKAFISSFIHSPLSLCTIFISYRIHCMYVHITKEIIDKIEFLNSISSPHIQSVFGWFKVSPWRRSRENLMVVYSGASAEPSHLFHSFRRRRGIYCNLRRIDSAYLFRLSLCWDHRRQLTFSHKRRLAS